MASEIKIPNAEEFITSSARSRKARTVTAQTVIKHILEEIDAEDQKAQLRRIGMAPASVPAGCTWEVLQEAIKLFNADGSWNIYTRNSRDDRRFGVIVQPSREVALRLRPDADR
jgi:hypothetical protein